MKALVAIAVLSAASAHAQLAFKGLPLGVDRQQLTQQFPSLRCQQVPPQFSRLGEQRCTSAPCNSDACRASEKALGSYGGMPAWDTGFSVVGGRVAAFDLVVNATSYEAVREALREVHGAGEEQVVAMQTAGGAKVNARLWTVKTADGKISLYERAVNYDTGRVQAETTAFTRWLEAAPASRKNARDL